MCSICLQMFVSFFSGFLVFATSWDSLHLGLLILWLLGLLGLLLGFLLGFLGLLLGLLLVLLWLLSRFGFCGFCAFLPLFGFLALLTSLWLFRFCYKTEEYCQQQPPTLTTSNNAKAMHTHRIMDGKIRVGPEYGKPHAKPWKKNTKHARQQSRQQELDVQYYSSDNKSQQRNNKANGGRCLRSCPQPLPLFIFKAMQQQPQQPDLAQKTMNSMNNWWKWRRTNGRARKTDGKHRIPTENKETGRKMKEHR